MGDHPMDVSGAVVAASAEDDRFDEVVDRAADLIRRVSAEFVGTFALVLVAAGAEVVANRSAGEVDRVARAMAPGMLVGAMIYAIGDVSGAHFNPLVSLAFTIQGLFPPKWLPAYWLGQIGGAVAAATTLQVLLGDASASVPRAALDAGPAMAIEGLLTFILLTVILGTADRYAVVGPDAALAVGATIALCGLWAGPLTGPSMNPFRWLGPALVAGRPGDVAVYLVGPLVGTLAALGVARLLRGPVRRDRATMSAAEGDAPAER